MAAYHHILQHTTSRVESPAKIFAKLKSKVDREASCGKDGVYPRQDLLGKVKEKHGAEFQSPRKRTHRNWITDENSENVCEARALTISPLSSPQANSHPDWGGKPAEDALCVGERGRGCTPRKGGFLESSLRSQPIYTASRTRGLAEAPQPRDGFDVIHRTQQQQQQKIQAAENESMLGEVRAPPMPPSSVFSPMRSKLRKRKLESWGLHTEPCPLGELQTPIDTHSEDLAHLKGFSTRRCARESVSPAPSFPAKTRGGVMEDRVHLLSPAKMFAYMKERENRPEQHEGRKLAGTRNLFGCNRGNFHQSAAPPASAACSVNRPQEGDGDSVSVVESGTPASQPDVELADSQSDTDASEDARVPAVLSHRVLLEDPLILNSPQVSIPKKCGPVYKTQNWPLPTDYPCENGIHLRGWFLRRKGKDLFVEGIHREKNIPWNSNIIVDRVSHCVLKTITGSFYILDGKMNLRANTGFPKWFLKKFLSGFPSNWNKLYEKFLSARNEEKSKDRGSLATLRSEANLIMPPPSIAQKATQSANTPENRPPDPPASAKVSRSGRLIKPPLEYWKGGRVLIDAHMNVTIHESYDTSLCSPEANATMSLRSSARLFSPSNDECQPSKAATAKETSGPLRKLKLPVPRRNRARANQSEKPSLPPEAPPKPSRRRTSSSSSSEGEHGRRRRSRQKGRAVERALHANTQAHQQTENSSALRRPRKPKRDGKKPPATARGRERSASASRPSAASDADTNDPSPPTESVATRRSQRKKEVRNYREDESHQSGRAAKKTSGAPTPGVAAPEQKQSKATKTSGRVKPAQSSKRRKADGGSTPGRLEEEDQHKWTESELRKLNEAVSLYPRHMGDHWAKVARTVGTRSAEECHQEHTFKNAARSPAKKQTRKSEEAKQPGAGSQASQDKVVISARVGTLRRKKQVRQFLENMAKDNNDDIFTLAAMKNKAFERAAACPFSTTNNHEFTLSNLGPLTPVKASFPLVKTPHALPISPDMLGSPNCVGDDKLVYHLQKKVKKNQVNVCKPAAMKSFKLTPSVNRAVKRCGNAENDNFVVWEMFPGKDSPVLSDSEEEKDFYFSDDD